MSLHFLLFSFCLTSKIQSEKFIKILPLSKYRSTNLPKIYFHRDVIDRMTMEKFKYTEGLVFTANQLSDTRKTTRLKQKKNYLMESSTRIEYNFTQLHRQPDLPPNFYNQKYLQPYLASLFFRGPNFSFEIKESSLSQILRSEKYKLEDYESLIDLGYRSVLC